MSSSDSSNYTRHPPGAFLPGGLRTDPPLPSTSPTLGTKLFHFMLRIRDPAPTLHFYINLLGMRTVFTMNGGPFTIYYLGFPQTPEDRADLQAWAERTSGNLAHTHGLLELYHIHGSEKQPQGYYSTGNDPPSLGFGQLGFSVPDVGATVKRLEEAGVRVLKPLGVATRESIPLSGWEAERGVGVGEVDPVYALTYKQIAAVADPDGYFVELVPQVMKSAEEMEEEEKKQSANL